MPRTISAGLLSAFQSDILTLAVLVKIARVDDVVLGFTSFNQSLTVSGVTYIPYGSAESRSVKQSTDSSVDNTEFSGILSSDLITDEDIRAGKYDYADFTVMECNYSDLTQGTVILLRGKFGEVTLTDGKYMAEVRSLTNLLQQQICDLTSLTCRVRRLGDPECKVDMTAANRRNTRSVVAVDATQRFITFNDTNVAGYYMAGRIWFTTGANAGATAIDIKDNTATGTQVVVNLRLPFPYVIAVGDSAVVEVGCDRRFDTCVAKFNNAINFRGEPHVPGSMAFFQVGRPPVRH